jgi:hypothetical protein
MGKNYILKVHNIIFTKHQKVTTPTIQLRSFGCQFYKQNNIAEPPAVGEEPLESEERWGV